MNVKVTMLSSGQFITEFPDKGWTKNSINRLLVKLRKFGTVGRVIFLVVFFSQIYYKVLNSNQ